MWTEDTHNCNWCHHMHLQTQVAEWAACCVFKYHKWSHLSWLHVTTLWQWIVILTNFAHAAAAAALAPWGSEESVSLMKTSKFSLSISPLHAAGPKLDLADLYLAYTNTYTHTHTHWYCHSNCTAVVSQQEVPTLHPCDSSPHALPQVYFISI